MSLTVGFSTFLAYAFLYLKHPQWQYLSAEGSFIEVCSVFVFSFAALIFFFLFVKTRRIIDFIYTVLMFFAAAREADLHKEWTKDSILKTRFYLDQEVPLNEKICGLIIIGLLIYCAIQLLKRAPQFISNLLRFHSAALGTSLALGILFLAKIIDSKDRLPYVDDTFADIDGMYLRLFEESLELAAALFFMTVAIMLVRRR